MARKMTEWPSKRGPITKIMPSDGCIGDTVPLAVGKWYEFHEFGWHMGNVGLVIAKHMKIPTYLVFDADADKPEKNGSQGKHEKDNKALLSLLGKPDENPMPDKTIWGDGFTIWHSDIGAVVEAEIGKDAWKIFRAEADKRYGHAGKLGKNSLHIGASLAFAWEADKRSDSLEQLCTAILSPGNDV